MSKIQGSCYGPIYYRTTFHNKLSFFFLSFVPDLKSHMEQARLQLQSNDGQHFFKATKVIVKLTITTFLVQINVIGTKRVTTPAIFSHLLCRPKKYHNYRA